MLDEKITTELSTEGAKRFAMAIFSDIAAYVAAHRDEYEKWKQEERSFGIKNEI
jgi:hypothetical protein